VIGNDWRVRYETCPRSPATTCETLKGDRQGQRRAFRLGARDARRQRRRNLEFVEKMTQIAALLKAFLERGGNGKH
jgi:hypothetical protein